MMLGARTAAWAKSGDDIQFVDWIASDGNAYIDTEYVPSTVYLTFDVSLAKVRNDGNWSRMLFGVSETNSNFYTANSVGVLSVNSINFISGKSRVNYNSLDGVLNDGVIHDLHIKSSSNISQKFMNSILYVDDNSHGVGTAADSSASDEVPQRSIFVFGANYNGNCVGKPNANIGLKIGRISFATDAGVVECDFRSAKNKDGEFGLYDLVSKTWHGGIGGVIIGHDKA